MTLVLVIAVALNVGIAFGFCLACRLDRAAQDGLTREWREERP